jgi:plastocyanin
VAGIATLVAAACAPATNPPTFPISTSGAKFLTYVPDSLNDAGRGASVAIDSKGQPVVSYLMTKAELGPTDIPPIVKPGQAQPPAVMLASLNQKGLWVTTSVTPQLTSPRKGDEAKLLGGAFEIANSKGQAIPGVTTDLALDSGDHHYVVWSTPTGVFYATDASGSFGDPEQVTKDPAVGGAVAVGAGGAPWVSFITTDGLQVATKSGGGWKAESVASFSNIQTPGLATAIGIASDGRVLVAFGDGTKTMLTRGSGTGGAGGWTTEPVPGPGGLGVSMALDKSGNPHLAFYDPGGGIHHAHSLGGASWTVNDLGTVATSSNQQQTQQGWGTGIALDDKGVHYAVWADTAANRVVLAQNAGGQFTTQPIPTSLNGLNPSIAVSSDGKTLAAAWFDSTNKNLDVATAGGPEGLALAFAPAALSPGATASAAQCQPGDSTTLSIESPSAAGFDKTCLAVKADAAFTVDFKNSDTSTPHNWELFTDSAATSRLGGANGITDPVAPGTSTTYKVNALKAGTYFYRCDFHPTTMTGTFVVGSSASASPSPSSSVGSSASPSPSSS